MQIYEPREDSELLRNVIKEYSKGFVLDMGTGTGILAQEAAKTADTVLAVDINKKAIEYCKNNIKNEKITFKQSDLFENIKEKFDLIIFNPPYLPEDKKAKDISLDGGKRGYELIEKFLKQAKKHLKSNGKVLLLYSSLTNKEKIQQIIKENNYDSKIIKTKKLFFEELYVVLIKKRKLLAQKVI